MFYGMGLLMVLYTKENKINAVYMHNERDRCSIRVFHIAP